jgi:hypothetical protein
MSKELWSCLSAVCIGLSGCAAALPVARQLDAPVGCNAGICFVDVWVSNCDQGGIETDPYELIVSGLGRPKNIRWRLRSEGFVFAYNGIVITNPSGEFDQPEMAANGQMFKWRDKITKVGKYKYAVNVVKTGENPQACLTYDPLISNR